MGSSGVGGEARLGDTVPTLCATPSLPKGLGTVAGLVGSQRSQGEKSQWRLESVQDNW